MTFAPRISLITLGVLDLARATRFYEGLGWRKAPASQESVTFIQLGNIVLSLFPREELAKDAGVDAGVEQCAAGFSGIALAYNASSEDEVDRLMALAVDTGARLVKTPQKVFWGGYSGYFEDPEGHLWELAYNPFFPLDDKGNVRLPAMDHDRYADGYIADILKSVRTVAVVGASANPVRPSHFVMKYLIDKGFEVFPVNPGQAGKEILGRPVAASLADLAQPVDMVDLFRASDAVPGIVDDILAMKNRPKVVWMQLGVRDDSAAARLEDAGIKVVMNRCPKIEYARLSGEIGWSGVNSRRISSRKNTMRPGFQKFGLRGGVGDDSDA
jgi:predicted CoA-binding protein/predicted lactoylglutathione lyase